MYRPDGRPPRSNNAQANVILAKSRGKRLLVYMLAACRWYDQGKWVPSMVINVQTRCQSVSWPEVGYQVHLTSTAWRVICSWRWGCCCRCWLYQNNFGVNCRRVVMTASAHRVGSASTQDWVVAETESWVLSPESWCVAGPIDDDRILCRVYIRRSIPRDWQLFNESILHAWQLSTLSTSVNDAMNGR